MKKLALLSALLIGSIASIAQLKDPVQWDFKAVKKEANSYEIVITATLPQPWHIYSQNTPKGGPRPTIVSFNKNPLVSLDGKVKEVGKLKKEKDEIFKVNVMYYGDKVEFVQKVKVKGAIKTNLTGTVEYMVCDDEQCLPPTRKSFDIKLM